MSSKCGALANNRITPARSFEVMQSVFPTKWQSTEKLVRNFLCANCSLFSVVFFLSIFSFFYFLGPFCGQVLCKVVCRCQTNRQCPSACRFAGRGYLNCRLSVRFERFHLSFIILLWLALNVFPQFPPIFARCHLSRRCEIHCPDFWQWFC